MKGVQQAMEAFFPAIHEMFYVEELKQREGK